MVPPLTNAQLVALREVVTRQELEQHLFPILKDSQTTYRMDREDPRSADVMQILGFVDVKKIYDVIRQLEVEDYSDGPKENNSPHCPKMFKDGDVWFFGKELPYDDNQLLEVYIKICYASVGTRNFVACVSFHLPERTINYPFKG